MKEINNEESTSQIKDGESMIEINEGKRLEPPMAVQGIRGSRVAVEWCQSGGCLMEGVLCILTPGQELAPAVLMFVTECQQEVSSWWGFQEACARLMKILLEAVIFPS